MSTVEILNLISSILLTLVLLGLINLKAYSVKKGKNLARKEDIELITEKIENVKSELQLVTDTRTSLNKEKRISLVSVFEKHHLWLIHLMAVPFSHLDDEEMILNDSAKSDALSFDFKAAMGRCKVFYINAEFDEHITELTKQTIKRQNKFDLFLLHVRQANLKISQAKSNASSESGM